MVFLETERLCLRNVALKDAAIIYDYRNNEACARYQRGQTKDRAGIDALVKARQQDSLSTAANALLAIALRESDEIIGEVVVMPKDGAITLGYTISYRHHRQGYAFEALTALTNWLHTRFPGWDFVCFTDPANQPSMALLRKLGYQQIGYAPRIQSEVFGKWLSPRPKQNSGPRSARQTDALEAFQVCALRQTASL